MLRAENVAFKIGDREFTVPAFWREEDFSLLLSPDMLLTGYHLNTEARSDMLYSRIEPAIVLASI